MLTVNEALTIPITGKNVVVIGLPGSGKTWFCSRLAAEGHAVFHTDDFIYMGTEGMYTCMGKVLASELPTIVEGVDGYRMIRKGVETDLYYPDIVFEVIAPEDQRWQVYETERPGKNFANVLAFDKALGTILSKYRLLMDGKEMPQWVQVDNVRP